MATYPFLLQTFSQLGAEQGSNSIEIRDSFWPQTCHFFSSCCPRTNSKLTECLEKTPYFEQGSTSLAKKAVTLVILERSLMVPNFLWLCRYLLKT